MQDWLGAGRDSVLTLGNHADAEGGDNKNLKRWEPGFWMMGTTKQTAVSFAGYGASEKRFQSYHQFDADFTGLHKDPTE